MNLDIIATHPLQFRLSGVHHSFANALRRTLLGNIPIMVMKPDQCDISVNTSRFTNEIIKSRLACIPIHHTTDVMEVMTITVSKKNDTTGILYVTTEDFTPSKLFPPSQYKGLDGKHHTTFIEFLRLRPGEEIRLTCTTSVGTGNESGMYNSVGTCSYGFTQDKEESDRVFSHEKESKENWDLLGAKRIVKPNSYDFILESIGVFKEPILLLYAVEVIKAQLNACKRNAEVCESVNTLPHCFDISMTGNYTLNTLSVEMKGDYTLGKLLEYQVYLRYNPITYVSYYKKHPHDAKGILRVAFPTATPDTVKALLHEVCDECTAQLDEFVMLLTKKSS